MAAKKKTQSTPTAKKTAKTTMPKKKTSGVTKLLLVDGHALAYRAHFAFAGQNLTDASGNATETTFGFFRMLAKIIHDRKPTHFVLCFDPGREENPRYTLYAEYKANRAAMPDELRRQIEDIKAIATELNLPPIIVEGAEADDTIASLVEQRRAEFDRVEILSGDKDLYNILHKNVVMLRSRTGVTEMEEIDEAWVRAKLGITREQVPDYMALVGDTSDNIPGVKGVGEKTASKLIAEFKSLETIYRNIAKIKPEGLKTKLETSREMAYISQKLVTLRKDIPLNFETATLKLLLQPNGAQVFRERKLPTVANEWEKLLKSLHASTALSDRASTALSDRASTALSDRASTALSDHASTALSDHASTALSDRASTAPNDRSLRAAEGSAFCSQTLVVKKASDLAALLQKLSTLDEICVDTETTGLSPHDDEIFGISFGWRERTPSASASAIYKSAYIPLAGTHSGAGLNPDYADIDAAEKFLPLLKNFLEAEHPKKIGQNVKFDLQVFQAAGIEVAGYSDDTMLLSFLLNPNVRRHNMDDMAEDHLAYKTVTFSELVGKGKSALPIGAVPLERLTHYACEDAEVTLALYDALLPKVKDAHLEQIYRGIDFPLAKVIATMEYDGVAIDLPYLADLARDYKKKIASAEKLIYKHAGEEFNIASTKQLQAVLFEKLKIESTRKTEKGALSTDQSVLEELKDAHPIMAPILEYRLYSKLLGTYAEALPHYVAKATGRVHTSLSQVTAATGRLSSLDPNLQNIPIKGDEGAKLRAAFIAAKGATLLSLDYSQIELRILAHYSRDKNLIAAYAADADIHDRAAYMLFRSRFDETKGDFSAPGRDVVFEIDGTVLQKMKSAPHFSDLRSQAKVLNFSIVYGVTEFGLARNLSISRADAKELMHNYFAAFPGIKTYMADAIAAARSKGYAETLFGRRRAIGDMQNANRFVREGAERLAINTPIQGTAADLIKKAMITIHEKIRRAKLRSRMVLQIHDELLFEVARGEERAIEDLARHAMENAIALAVPLKVSGAFGANWNECKA